jgi:hypothetical protein
VLRMGETNAAGALLWLWGAGPAAAALRCCCIYVLCWAKGSGVMLW